MRRLSIFAAFAALIVSGCGTRPASPLSSASHPPAQPGTQSAVGCMGPCLPKLKVGLPPTAEARLSRVPDVSEWQPCVQRAIPTVFRLAYGSRQDTRALCNGRFLAAHHVWRAGYVYLLPGSCTAQANAGARIIRAVGGVDVVIADGEERLGAGFQRCFLDRVGQLTHLPTADYTGCFSGLERIQPLWVPSYGAPPVCGPYKAWQYTDGSYCGEPYVTDCSFDYGITALGRKPAPKPKPKPNRRKLDAEIRKLDAEIRTLRALILKHQCVRRSSPRHTSRLPACLQCLDRRGRALHRMLG